MIDKRKEKSYDVDKERNQQIEQCKTRQKGDKNTGKIQHKQKNGKK